MAVTSDKPTPYAPVSVMLELIQRHRTKGLPAPINAEVLARAGVAESLIPRTLQALHRLDLIDEDGKPTDIFEGIQKAPEGEYKQRLAEWLNSAYGDVIKFVDPAKDDEVAVRDAFRSYIPFGQRDRMVSLFLGLYAAAGVAPEKSATVRPARQRLSPMRIVRPVSALPKTAHNKPVGGRKAAADPAGLPEPLAGMLSHLPDKRIGWTQADRDKFMATFGAVLDFCFPIVTQAALDAVDADGGDDEA